MKHMCKHGAACQSILLPHLASENRSSSGVSQQDISCLCKPGYTGQYCEYATAFRLDGTYSLKQYLSLAATATATATATMETATSPSPKLQVKFDFRLRRPFRLNATARLPLIHFESYSIKNNLLLFEVALHRDYIDVVNTRLGLSEKLGFYSEDEDAWHSLELLMLDENTYQINYSVKPIRLHVSRRFHLINVNLTRSAQFMTMIKRLFPTSFTIGRAYHPLYQSLNAYEAHSDWQRNDDYLANACIRDFILNNKILFKKKSGGSEKSSQSNGSPNLNPSTNIKFGCGEKLDYDFCAKSATCLNEASCLNDWFGPVCVGCRWPFYGRQCQLEATKLAFINKLNQMSHYMMSRNEAILSLSLFKINAALKLDLLPKYFKISFDLHRIGYRQHHAASTQPLTFLLLKQATARPDRTKSYFLLGVNAAGFLNLKKIQTDYDMNQFSFNLPFKVLWTVQNDRINLNSFQTSYTARIGLKLSENLVEMSVNGSYVSRFELAENEYRRNGYRLAGSNNGGEKFQIEGVKFQNFDSVIYLNDTFSVFKPQSQSSYFNSLNFLVHNLNVDENYFVFSNLTNSNSLRLTVLDSRMNYLLDTRDFFSASNLIVLNASVSDFDQVQFLNRNYFSLCFTRQQRQAFEQTRNIGNISTITTTNNDTNKTAAEDAPGVEEEIINK